MTTEQVVAACFWYLEHLPLILLPLALFDLIFWAGILLWWRHHRRVRGTL